MNIPSLYSSGTPSRTASKNVLHYTVSVLLIAITAASSLSSCQRAPQALFSPTYHPAPQRLAVDKPVNTVSTDTLLTASSSETVPLLTRPIWAETAASVPMAVTAPASDKAARRFWMKHRQTVPPQCDQIVLRNGDVIEAKIKEVGVNEIKYKKCARQDGPDYTISKRDVLSIKYSTGDVERFNAASTSSSGNNRSSYDSPTNAQNDGPQTDPFAIVAIATGGLAILTGYGAFLLGAAAIVFGALSLSRIRKEPGRFKGKGLAIGGMVAGLVAAGLILLYILF